MSRGEGRARTPADASLAGYPQGGCPTSTIIGVRRFAIMRLSRVLRKGCQSDMTGGSQLHEEDGSDKITFRLPSRLKEQYKEQVDNMSADLEEYVRRCVDEPDDTNEGPEPWDPPKERDLAIAYRTLCKIQSSSGTVRGEKAKRALAQTIDYMNQDDAYRVLRRLEDRGYVHLQGSPPPGGRLAVHVRPFSKVARTDDGGATARAD